MDSHVLPLDMTVYGAVHHHEVRKSNGTPVPFNMIWQGVYTVKYKKVPGPPPTSEGSQCSFSISTLWVDTLRKHAKQRTTMFQFAPKPLYLH